MAQAGALYIAMGVVVGLIVDYLAGSIPVAASMAALVASVAGGTLAACILRGLAAGVLWLITAYAIIGSVIPGSLDMIELASEIAGIDPLASYSIAVLAASLSSVSTSIIVYYLIHYARH